MKDDVKWMIWAKRLIRVTEQAEAQNSLHALALREECRCQLDRWLIAFHYGNNDCLNPQDHRELILGLLGNKALNYIKWQI